VNAAYTSQTDSRHGILLGFRDGDQFHCYDGVVLDADQNAAQNILARSEDPEIDLWTSHVCVKSILLDRTEKWCQSQKSVGTAQPRLQLEPCFTRPSTESEVFENFFQV